MQFTMKTYVLRAALEKTFAVVSRASTDPVLAQVNCVVSAGAVEFTGSDGEITVITKVEQADIEEEGTVLLPLRFFNSVKALPEEDVHVNTDETNIHITCAGYTGSARLGRDDYPEIDRAFEGGTKVPRPAFTSALSRVRSAIQTDTIRPIFMFVEMRNGVARATDGMKYLQVDVPFDIHLLIPSKAVDQVLRRARGMALDEITVGETERNLIFVMDEDIVIAQKHAAEYPDVEDLMLRPALLNDEELVLDRKVIADMVERVSIMADADTKFMSITIDNKQGSSVLTLAALDKSGNEAQETLDVHWPHADRVIGVNHNFLADVVGALAENQFTISFGHDEANRPSSILFREPGFSGVLMQLRADLGAAAKGSKRNRAAQTEPVGWGHHGLTEADEAVLASSTDDEIDDDEEGFSFSAAVAEKS